MTAQSRGGNAQHFYLIGDINHPTPLGHLGGRPSVVNAHRISVSFDHETLTFCDGRHRWDGHAVMCRYRQI
jgi:hypothetical protein